MNKKLIFIAIPICLILAVIVMDKSQKEIWFDGSNEISTSLPELENELDDMGQYFLGIINLMPGMTSVRMIEQGPDFVTLQTNEGIMNRTNMRVQIEKEKILIEFDEEYQAGKTITTNSHFTHEFKSAKSSLNHRLIISDLEAPGFMGFFYRNFGSKNIGNAFLKAYKTKLEK